MHAVVSSIIGTKRLACTRQTQPLDLNGGELWTSPHATWKLVRARGPIYHKLAPLLSMVRPPLAQNSFSKLEWSQKYSWQLGSKEESSWNLLSKVSFWREDLHLAAIPCPKSSLQEDWCPADVTQTKGDRRTSDISLATPQAYWERVPWPCSLMLL